MPTRRNRNKVSNTQLGSSKSQKKIEVEAGAPDNRTYNRDAEIRNHSSPERSPSSDSARSRRL